VLHALRVKLPERTHKQKDPVCARAGRAWIVWWSIGAGVHVELHSHANEQIVWMLTACERGLPVEVELLLMA
jgi:hypothetical protein